MSSLITVNGPDGVVSCHIEQPSTLGPHPLLVVLQEIFGVNEEMRSILLYADEIGAA